MEKIFITCDQHFGHANIIQYCERGFKTVSEMDDVMILAWNKVVGPHDTVYHVGDFTLGNEYAARRYFQQLNGRIYVVPGTHDARWIGKGVFYSASLHEVIELPMMHAFLHNGRCIVLCHYSMRTWPQSYMGSVHFYGHSHGRLRDYGLSMDVGVDVVGYQPLLLEDAIQRVEDSYQKYISVRKEYHVQRDFESG